MPCPQSLRQGRKHRALYIFLDIGQGGHLEDPRYNRGEQACNIDSSGGELDLHLFDVCDKICRRNI